MDKRNKNTTSYLNRFAKHSRKGFSFLEIMMSVFLFCLIMTTVLTIFLKVMNVQRVANSMQRNLEDAKFVMEEMAKTIKASEVVSCNEDVNDDCSDATSIEIFNYSQSRCIQYKIEGDSIKTASFLPENGPEDCISFGEAIDMTGNNNFLSNVHFMVSKTDTTLVPPVIGKVTISMEVCSDYRGTGCNDQKSDKFSIQTTASLRQ